MYIEFYFAEEETEIYLTCMGDFVPDGVDITFGSSGKPLHFSSEGT